jgi:homocysteine S-methyltransferase
MGAHALGIQNIFTIMGDRPTSNERSDTSNLPNLTTTSALKMMKGFNNGYGLSGDSLGSHAAFFKGAAFNASPKNLTKELRLLESKIEAGADFLLTQPVYSSESVIKIAQIIGGFPIPVLIGILPLRSKRNAEFLENEVPGITIPKNVMAAISSASHPRETGMKMCQVVAKELQDISAGVYYMAPFGKYETIIEFANGTE